MSLVSKSIDQVWLERHQELLALINQVIEETQPPDVPDGHSNKHLLRLQGLTNEIKQLLDDNDHHWDVDYDRRRG